MKIKQGMSSEENLRHVLKVLNFEHGLANFAQDSVLAYNLHHAIEYLQRALDEINPPIDVLDIDFVPELNNLSHLVDPYYKPIKTIKTISLDDRAKAPLLLGFGGADNGVYEAHIVETKPIKTKVAEYLTKTKK